jgi:hypothetical protein
MADAAAMAEPGHAWHIDLVWGERLLDLLVDPNNNHGDDAVAAEPHDHSRWILVCLLTAGAIFMYVVASSCWEANVGSIMVCVLFLMPVCTCLSLLAGGSIADWLTGFPAGENRRIVDNLLQV